MNAMRIVLLCIGVSMILSDSTSKEKEISLPIPVFTSILPQKYFVKKIGGDRVQVDVLVGPGKSPATYEPTPQQAMSLGSAKILFTIGVPFEKAFIPVIEKSVKALKIVNTASGIKKRMIEGQTHDDEKEHNDDHKGIPDPHIWMSPELVKKQAKHIYTALVDVDPAGKKVYKAGFDQFIKELSDVDSQLKSALVPLKGNTIFVYYPVLGYFGDRYGIKQVAIETGGKKPVPSVLEKIIAHAKEEKVKVIFVRPGFSKTSAQSVAEAIGGIVVSLNPLNPDYINNLTTIASEIKNAFK